MIGPVEMGALLKKIRLSKNLTLKELASDYLSVSCARLARAVPAWAE